MLPGVTIDEKQIAAVESDLKSMKAMIADSADLRTLLYSPAFDAGAKRILLPMASFTLILVAFTGQYRRAERIALLFGLYSMIYGFSQITAGVQVRQVGTSVRSLSPLNKAA